MKKNLMTKKQRKKLAQRLADLEYAVHNSPDLGEVAAAKDEIQRLSAGLSLDDMIEIDVMTSEILLKKS